MSTLEPTIDVLFDRLDAWRHFPAYQLERRADIFFSLYLREVVELERGVKLAGAIIPEVPIKLPNNQQSVKADYLLTAADHSRAYLVELKTDPRSLRDEQDLYLREAAAAGIESLLEGIRSIVLATKAKTKYFHLVRELERLELLRLPSDLERSVFTSTGQALTKKLGEITLTAHRPTIEVLYIQPLASGSEAVIDFECFARHVARHPDPLSQRFSQSLLRWRSPAGTSDAQAEIARGIAAEPH